MAEPSVFLQQKAAEEAAKITQQFGAGTYGSTEDLQAKGVLPSYTPTPVPTTTLTPGTTGVSAGDIFTPAQGRQSAAGVSAAASGGNTMVTPTAEQKDGSFLKAVGSQGWAGAINKISDIFNIGNTAGAGIALANASAADQNRQNANWMAMMAQQAKGDNASLNNALDKIARQSLQESKVNRKEAAKQTQKATEKTAAALNYVNSDKVLPTMAREAKANAQEETAKLKTKTGKFLSELAYSAGQMVPDILIGQAAGAVVGGVAKAAGLATATAAGADAAIAGNLAKTAANVAGMNVASTVGLGNMFAGVYSGTMTDLIQNGVDADTAAKNALGHAVLEVGTEILGGGLPYLGDGVLGKGLETWATKLAESAPADVAKAVGEAAAKSPEVAKSLGLSAAGFGKFLIDNPFGKLLLDAYGEGAEEVASEFLSPFLDYSTGLTDKLTMASAGDLATAFAGGAVMGGVLGMPRAAFQMVADGRLKVETNSKGQTEVKTETDVPGIETRQEVDADGKLTGRLIYWDVAADKEVSPEDYKARRSEYFKARQKANDNAQKREYYENNAQPTEGVEQVGANGQTSITAEQAEARDREMAEQVEAPTQAEPVATAPAEQGATAPAEQVVSNAMTPAEQQASVEETMQAVEADAEEVRSTVSDEEALASEKTVAPTQTEQGRQSNTGVTTPIDATTARTLITLVNTWLYDGFDIANLLAQHGLEGGTGYSPAFNPLYLNIPTLNYTPGMTVTDFQNWINEVQAAVTEATRLSNSRNRPVGRDILNLVRKNPINMELRPDIIKQSFASSWAKEHGTSLKGADNKARVLQAIADEFNNNSEEFKQKNWSKYVDPWKYLRGLNDTDINENYGAGISEIIQKYKGEEALSNLNTMLDGYAALLEPLGIEVRWMTPAEMIRYAYSSGQVVADGNVLRINPMWVYSPATMAKVFGHELTHVAQRQGRLLELHQAVESLAEVLGIEYADMAELVGQIYQTSDTDTINREVDARFVGYLLANEDILGEIAKVDTQSLDGLKNFVESQVDVDSPLMPLQAEIIANIAYAVNGMAQEEVIPEVTAPAEPSQTEEEQAQPAEEPVPEQTPIPPAEEVKQTEKPKRSDRSKKTAKETAAEVFTPKEEATAKQAELPKVAETIPEKVEPTEPAPKAAEVKQATKEPTPIPAKQETESTPATETAEEVDTVSTAEIKQANQTIGEQAKANGVLPFYGHDSKTSGSQAYFSQWYPAKFVVDGVEYQNAEQFMMAGKARLFGDTDSLQKIMATSDPKTCKELGRKVKGFNAAKWAAERLNLVIKGNIAKFSQNPEMRKALLDTGNQVLCEASPYDKIWGIGMGKTNPAAADPSKWKGQNLLGQALMATREALRSGISAEEAATQQQQAASTPAQVEPVKWATRKDYYFPGIYQAKISEHTTDGDVDYYEVTKPNGFTAADKKALERMGFKPVPRDKTKYRIPATNGVGRMIYEAIRDQTVDFARGKGTAWFDELMGARERAANAPEQSREERFLASPENEDPYQYDSFSTPTRTEFKTKAYQSKGIQKDTLLGDEKNITKMLQQRAKVQRDYGRGFDYGGTLIVDLSTAEPTVLEYLTKELGFTITEYSYQNDKAHTVLEAPYTEKRARGVGETTLEEMPAADAKEVNAIIRDAERIFNRPYNPLERTPSEVAELAGEVTTRQAEQSELDRLAKENPKAAEAMGVLKQDAERADRYEGIDVIEYNEKEEREGRGGYNGLNLGQRTYQDFTKELNRLDAIINDPQSSETEIAKAKESRKYVQAELDNMTDERYKLEAIIRSKNTSEKQKADAQERLDALKARQKEIDKRIFSRKADSQNEKTTDIGEIFTPTDSSTFSSESSVLYNNASNKDIAALPVKENFAKRQARTAEVEAQLQAKRETDSEGNALPKDKELVKNGYKTADGKLKVMHYQSEDGTLQLADDDGIEGFYLTNEASGIPGNQSEYYVQSAKILDDTEDGKKVMLGAYKNSPILQQAINFVTQKYLSKKVNPSELASLIREATAIANEYVVAEGTLPPTETNQRNVTKTAPESRVPLLDYVMTLSDSLANVAQSRRMDVRNAEAPVLTKAILQMLGFNAIKTDTGLIVLDQTRLRKVGEAEIMNDIVGESEFEGLEDEAEQETVDSERLSDEEAAAGVKKAGWMFGTIDDSGVPRRTSPDRQKAITRTSVNFITDEQLKDVGGEGDINRAMLSGEMDYFVKTRKQLADAAHQWLRRFVHTDANGMEHTDLAGALKVWFDQAQSDKVSYREAAGFGVKGMLLYAMLKEQMAKDNSPQIHDIMQKLMAEIGVLGSSTGLTLHTFNMLKQMTPEGRIYLIQRQIEKLTKEIKQRSIDKKTHKLVRNIQAIEALESYDIPEVYKDAMRNAKDAVTRDRIEDMIIQQVAELIPPTVESRVNAWRYLCMLGNVRTHMRNIFSNAAMYGVRAISRWMAGQYEDSSTKIQRGDHLTTNKQASKDVKTFAANDAEVMMPVLQHGGKTGFSDKLRDAMYSFGKSIGGRTLENLSRINGELLEREDAFFLKLVYKNALAKFITANGYDIETFKKAVNPDGSVQDQLALEQLNKAREYAIAQALEATYRTASELADALTKYENAPGAKGVARRLIIEGLVPFKRTPINILRSGIRYSPAGIVKGIAQIVQAKTGSDMDMATAVSTFCDGLTGTGIALLGGLLGWLGIAKAKGSNNDKEEYYDEMLGNQPFSIDVLGKNVTLDWLSPTSMPFFMGVALSNSMQEASNSGEDADGEDWSGISFPIVIDALLAMADPVTNLSMLSSLNDAINSYEKNKLGGIAYNAVESFALQFVPTMSGQAIRTFDPTRTTTYAPKDSDNILGQKGERFLNKLRNKSITARLILGSNEPYVDQWGREEDRGLSLGNAFNQFVNPAYVKDTNKTAVDDMLSDIFAESGNRDLLPKTPTSSTQINGQRYYLDSADYTNFKKTTGNLSYIGVDTAFASDLFNTLSADSQAKVISNIYDFARESAKAEYAVANGFVLSSDPNEALVAQAKAAGRLFEVDKDIARVEEAQQLGLSIGEYFIIKYQMNQLRKAALKREYAGEIGLNMAQRNLFL